MMAKVLCSQALFARYAFLRSLFLNNVAKTAGHNKINNFKLKR